MVKLNSKVKKIYWNPDLNPNNQVQVQTDKGFYQADVVLVTVSLGVLKKDADNIFQPYLPPAKTNAIKVIILKSISIIGNYYKLASSFSIWAGELSVKSSSNSKILGGK